VSDLFLDADEISNMTSRVQRAAQVRVLRGMGIEHRIRPDGTVAILRAHVERVFGAGPTNMRKNAPKEPNWEALDAARS
jgi:hypothetical protein